MKSSRYTFYSLVCIAILYLLAVVYWKDSRFKTYYNWDTLPYSYLSIDFADSDPNKSHEATFDLLKKEVSQQEFDRLVTGKERKLLYQESGEFISKLTFYRVKPLYSGLIGLFHQFGLNPHRAALLISILSFGIVLCLIQIILSPKNWFEMSLSIFFALLFLFSLHFNQLARLSTPDGLGAALIFLLFLAAKQPISRPWLIALLIVLLIACRIDFLFIILPAIVLWGEQYSFSEKLRKRWPLIVLSLFAALGLNFLANAFSEGHWLSNFDHLKNSSNYLNHLLTESPKMFLEPHRALSLGLAGILLLFDRSQRRRYVAILLIALILRFISFPSAQDRLYIFAELFILVFAIEFLFERFLRRKLTER